MYGGKYEVKNEGRDVGVKGRRL